MKSGQHISSGLLGCYLIMLGSSAFAAPELSDLEAWGDLPAMKMSKEIPAKSTSSDFYLTAGSSNDSEKAETRDAMTTESSRNNFRTPSASKPIPPYLKNGDDASQSSSSLIRKKLAPANQPVSPINSLDSLTKDSSLKQALDSQSDITSETDDQKKSNPEESRKLFERTTDEPTVNLFGGKTQSETHLTTTSIFGTVFIASIIFLVLWYQKQLKGKLRANQGLPIETLGQTWLDGQTKIIILRIGSKVLILAKSPSFCTTLDTITDPEEVNLLTLGSGTAGKEDFSKLLTQIKNQAGLGKKSREIPHESEIRSELDQLKQQLGSIGSSKS